MHKKKLCIYYRVWCIFGDVAVMWNWLWCCCRCRHRQHHRSCCCLGIYTQWQCQCIYPRHKIEAKLLYCSSCLLWHVALYFQQLWGAISHRVNDPIANAVETIKTSGTYTCTHTHTRTVHIQHNFSNHNSGCWYVFEQKYICVYVHHVLSIKCMKTGFASYISKCM